MLADPISKLALYRQGLGFVLGLLPALQAYAAGFFALPALRLLVDGRRNAAIDERNDNRLEVRGWLAVEAVALLAHSISMHVEDTSMAQASVE